MEYWSDGSAETHYSITPSSSRFPCQLMDHIARFERLGNHLVFVSQIHRHLEIFFVNAFLKQRQTNLPGEVWIEPGPLDHGGARRIFVGERRVDASVERADKRFGDPAVFLQPFVRSEPTRD